MKTLSLFLDRIANWKILLVNLAIYMVFNAVLLKNAENKVNELAQKTIGVIDLTFGFNPQKTLDMVANYGDEARAYYASVEMTTDVIYPIVYSFLFGIILTLLFRNKAYKPFPFVNLLPFLALIFDFAENTTIVILLKTFPNSSEMVATLCEIFKMCKWLSFGVAVGYILYGLVMLLVKKGKP